MSSFGELDDGLRRALEADRTVDITTTGRRSGEPRRIETWSYPVGDRVFLSGSPGSRDWIANLAAEPEFTFHVKRGAQADLPARARLIADEAERRQVFEALLPTVGREDKLDEWLAGSPLVEVEFL